MSLAKRHPVTLAIAALAVIALVGVSIWLARRPASSSTGAAGAASIEIVPLTETGDTALGVLSPDGKFVASVRRIDSQFSVWVRQLSTRSDVQIVPPLMGRRFVGLSVTPDGSFVDFVVTEPGVRPPSLWRVAFLGGTPRRLASDVWSATGWSPDGRRFAFVRAHAADAEDQIVVADADGSNERVLVTRHHPKRLVSDSFNTSAASRPTWSADGRRILAIGRQATEGARHEFVVFDADTGAELRTRPVPVLLLDSAWMDDTHALGNAYTPEKAPTVQLFDLNDGSSTPITQGLAVSIGASTTPDRKTAVSTLITSRSATWIGDGAGENLTPAVPDAPVFLFALSVSNTGTIVSTTGSVLSGFATNVSTPEARAPRQIGTSGDTLSLLSADGRSLFFHRGGKDGGIYSSALDGSNVRRLVDRADAGNLFITPDGQTLLFLSRTAEGIQSLWSAPAAGGPARDLTHGFVSSGTFSISPDSRRIAFSGARPTPASPTPRIMCDLPDCTNRREVPLRVGVWTPDGKGIAYVDNVDTANVMIQPIDGGPPRPMTHFTDGRVIDAFAWSPDGKRFAIARSVRSADIVLIKGFSGSR